ncbi:MAG: MBL fold metallo-hydrolase [Microcoleaceae cyanobacterium]
MAGIECFPYSVNHTDGGVCLRVGIGTYQILLDCGVQNISALVTDAALSLDAIFCSHAHADHARGLLEIHQRFPEVPIYTSAVTAHLLALNWPDVTAEQVVQFCQILPWHTAVEVQPGLELTLFPSGHLPGAASILMRFKAPERIYTLLYTGDFFISNSRLVEGLSMGELRGLKPDVLILEGSYGTTRHGHRRQLENQLAERIYQAVALGHSIILPTPALGLGQELLMLLRSHHYFTGQDIDIWVDGAVAEGCDAYLKLLSYFPSSVQNFAQYQSLFWDERVRPRVRRYDASQPQGVNPCIILTGDQMTQFRQYTHLWPGDWVLFWLERPGELVDQEALAHLAQMPVETYFLPEHSDGTGTTQLIHNVRRQHVVFVHGNPSYLADLTNLEELRNRYQVHSPAAGIPVELPLGEIFIQPALPETYYLGELTEHAMEVNIALPSTIVVDPRWLSLADTGLIEARWQGEELVIRSISQREFLSSSKTSPSLNDLDCCDKCRHYRSSRCWNPNSALYTFKVAPDGYCPVFEKKA